MSEAITPNSTFGITSAHPQAEPVRLPKPQPFGAPVLLADVATPLAGETVLSLLMKRMMAVDEDQTS